MAFTVEDNFKDCTNYVEIQSVQKKQFNNEIFMGTWTLNFNSCFIEIHTSRYFMPNNF